MCPTKETGVKKVAVRVVKIEKHLEIPIFLLRNVCFSYQSPLEKLETFPKTLIIKLGQIRFM